MIKLLAPTRAEAADEPDTTFIVEVSRDVFHAIKAAVEVAYEDEGAVPEELGAPGDELYKFFAEGTETP